MGEVMELIFSEKLQTLRKEKGLSQEQLAELLNVSRQAVSKWESGQTYPEIDKLIILSDVFNTTVDDLVKDKNIECAANSDDESEKEDEESVKNNADDVEDNLMFAGFIIGMAIGLITQNLMWATAGSFLGLGLGYIINEIRRKN